MVSNKVEVYSLSAKKDGLAQAHYWSSDGTGDFDLAEAEGVHRGTKIIIHLKEDAKQYAIKHIVEGVVKK
jgi:TNF receptor-associated protein 1